MTFNTVAILAPGEMGHAVGGFLHAQGVRVVTNLEGRSDRSRARAEKAGMENVGDDAELIARADLFLSILPPDKAMELARRLAPAIANKAGEFHFVDCNAVSPDTVSRIGKVIEDAGARFTDMGIIGAPPKLDAPRTRFYTSGPHAAELDALGALGLDVRHVGPDLGRASALKMCYASVTKGMAALAAESYVAGQALGVTDLLMDELSTSQTKVFEWIIGRIQGMPPKAYRWIGEMEEIAATFESVGLTPRIFLGAADMFTFIRDTPAGADDPASDAPKRELSDVIAVLAESL